MAINADRGIYDEDEPVDKGTGGLVEGVKEHASADASSAGPDSQRHRQLYELGGSVAKARKSGMASLPGPEQAFVGSRVAASSYLSPQSNDCSFDWGWDRKEHAGNFDVRCRLVPWSGPPPSLGPVVGGASTRRRVSESSSSPYSSPAPLSLDLGSM